MIITGVPVESGRVVAPLYLHKRIQSAYAELHSSHNDAERCSEIERLLSHLGTYRYHVGASSEGGRKAADRMNYLRQYRSKLSHSITTEPDPNALATFAGSSERYVGNPF